MKLKGRVAIVTGSSRGIGKATALLLAKEGASVVVTYLSRREEAESVLREIKAGGREAIAVQCDVAKSEDVKRLFAKTMEAFGTVDILVNNAGYLDPKPLMDIGVDDFTRPIAVNVVGQFLCAQEAASIMLKKETGKEWGKGCIINVTSVRGFYRGGRPGNLVYSASKAAAINQTKTMAMAFAPHIRVNSVAPGTTDTEILNYLSPEEKRQRADSTLLGKLAQPREVAEAVVYLASATGVTGEILTVDCGYSVK